MSDEKLTLLRHLHTLHSHPDQMRDPLFTSGSPFFDPRDLLQVKKDREAQGWSRLPRAFAPDQGSRKS